MGDNHKWDFMGEFAEPKQELTFQEWVMAEIARRQQWEANIFGYLKAIRKTQEALEEAYTNTSKSLTELGKLNEETINHLIAALEKTGSWQEVNQ